MLVYSFHPQTGELIGQDVADPSPLEPNVFLVPAGATSVAPPPAQAGKARVWNGSAWTLKPDHRGETWFGGPDGRQPRVITALGDPTTEGLASEPAPPTAEEQKAALLKHLAGKRYAAETGGISVGGIPVETDRVTQSMLTGAVLASQAPGGPKTFKWKGSTGFVELTAEQILGIATAVSLHVQACFATEAAIVEDIESGVCTTTSAIDAYTWPA